MPIAFLSLFLGFPRSHRRQLRQRIRLGEVTIVSAPSCAGGPPVGSFGNGLGEGTGERVVVGVVVLLFDKFSKKLRFDSNAPRGLATIATGSILGSVFRSSSVLWITILNSSFS